MTWLAKVRFHFRTLFAKRKLDEQLSKEIRTHVEMATEANVAAGMSPEEARYAALREFGNVAGIQERAREGRGWVWLEQLGQDVRYSARALSRTPGFSLVVVGTLTVGIGLAAAVIGLLWPTLFAPEANRFYQIGFKDKQNAFVPQRPGLYLEAYREQVTAFSSYAAVFRESANIVIEGRPNVAIQLRASNDCFSTLGIRPVMGRTFLPEEHSRDTDGVVILAGHYWRQHFNADPDVIGRTISIGQRTCTIIGVLDANQTYPLNFEGDIYRPLAFRADPANPLMPMLRIMGRLKPGVSVKQAEAQLAVVTLPAVPAWAAKYFAEQQTALQKSSRASRPETLWVVLIAALLLYVLACLNAMNLALVRLLRRNAELSIRLALGGTRGRVARILVLEGVWLTATAALIVAISAHWIFPLVFFAFTQREALLFHSGWNAPILGAVTGLSVLAAIVLVMVPVRQFLAADSRSQLNQIGRSATGSRNLSRLRQLLIMLQTALAVILLAGTGLMVRSFDKIRRVDLGLDPVGRVKVQVSFPSRQFAPTPEAHLQWFRRLAQRLEKLPGVREVAIGQDAFLVGDFWGTAQLQMADGTTQPVAGTIVSENMLTTAGLTLKRGRWLDERQRREVVINETLARARFGDKDPVGQSIRFNAKATDFLVVGVVKDVRETIRSGSGMRFYAPATLGPPSISILLVRLDRDPGPEFAGSVRQAIYEEEPAITVHVVKSVHDLVAGLMWAERNAFAVLKGLSIVALVLAMVGLFSVVIYTVESRTREFGVRLALGAMPSDLGRLVLSTLR